MVWSASKMRAEFKCCPMFNWNKRPHTQNIFHFLLPATLSGARSSNREYDLQRKCVVLFINIYIIALQPPLKKPVRLEMTAVAAADQQRDHVAKRYGHIMLPPIILNLNFWAVQFPRIFIFSKKWSLHNVSMCV